MKVRIKTLEELKSLGANIGNLTISGIGRYFMTEEMMSYLGCEIDLYYFPDEDLYYNTWLTGIYHWESWMFEEIKEMNRNGANE